MFSTNPGYSASRKERLPVRAGTVTHFVPPLSTGTNPLTE
jgi:hypothetical protein